MKLPIRVALVATTASLALAACATTPVEVPLAASAAVPAAVAPAKPVDTIDLGVPTQLPRTAIPRHYAISVTPDAANLKFDGHVAIDLDVVKATDTLTLNAANLTFGTVALRGPDGVSRPAQVSTDAKAQTATFAFGGPVAPGAYVLDIDYAGTINTQANGLFALDYKDPSGAAKRALFTQFEAADARRFVPSWDEPDYKATWDLTATGPAGQMAVSNMPAAKTETLPDGRMKVTFQTSPTMSSYLLFFGMGDFGRITKMAGNTEVGIVMGRGNEAKARTALDAEAQILAYYNDYFGVPFPLPKLDNVAGPGQSQFFSAMENWGAIFTFERVLLDDPAVTTERERQAIFGVEAHEMAHQWFGDLVTMAWWNDLWLNEGFASWMATKATRHFHPDWGAEFQTVGAREAAMGQDSLVTTHPIVQNVQTVEQANQAFDGITYSKGQSVISMLEGYAGSDVWQRGIQTYIKAHSYQNSRTDDLWQAVEAAGATGLTQIAHEFTLQPGVPLITVGAPRCVDGKTVATLTQGEFSVDRKPGQFQPLSWHVPVRASTGGQATTVVTDGATTDLTVDGCGPLLLNAGQTGYYRSLYAPATAKALLGEFTKLSTIDQYGLLEDQGSLSFAGYQPMGIALDFTAAIPLDADPQLIANGLGTWSGLYGLFDGNAAVQRRIATIISQRYAPVLQRIGFVPVAGEKPTISTLRPALIGALGRTGDARVMGEAKRLFAALQTDPNAIPGSLKNSWLGLIARNADAATWDRLHALAKAAPSAVQKQNYYSLLGSAKSDELARRALDLALTDEPGSTTSAGIINAVSGQHPEMALDFVIANWAKVEKLVDISAQSRFVARVGGGSEKAETIDKLNAYANAHIAATDRKPIDQAIAGIKVRLATEPRIKAQTLAWLNANKR